MKRSFSAELLHIAFSETEVLLPMIIFYVNIGCDQCKEVTLNLLLTSSFWSNWHFICYASAFQPFAIMLFPPLRPGMEFCILSLVL